MNLGASGWDRLGAVPGRRGRGRALLSVLFACLFGVFIVEQAPHLVHHFFEPDQVQPECPFAAASERQPGAPTAAVVAGVALLSAIPLPPLPTPRLVDTAARPAAARAPPFAS